MIAPRLTETTPSGNRFDRLVSQLCQEHYECIRIAGLINDDASATASRSLTKRATENGALVKKSGSKMPLSNSCSTDGWAGSRPCDPDLLLQSAPLQSATGMTMAYSSSDVERARPAPITSDPILELDGVEFRAGDYQDEDDTSNGFLPHGSVSTERGEVFCVGQDVNQQTSFRRRQVSWNFSTRLTSDSMDGSFAMSAGLSSGFARFVLSPPWQQQDLKQADSFDNEPGRASWRSERSSARSHQKSNCSSRKTIRSAGSTLENLADGIPCPLDCIVLAPNSFKRLLWDSICLILVTFDLITIPLQAFDFSETDFLRFSDWATRIFWTIDMPNGCCIGFYRRGRLHLSFVDTSRYYLTTWFGLDAVLVISDWLFYYLTTTDEGGTETSRGVVRMLRAARLARLLRLLRLLKLQRFIKGIEDMISTETLGVYFKCFKPFLALLFLVHVLACGWYGLGLLGSQGSGVPGQIYGSSDEVAWLMTSQIKERSKGYRYTTCLHWSVTQFTLSSMDVHANTSSERLFTIAVLLFGIIAFSALVSGFTSAAEHLREMRSDETKQFWLLRRFMKDYSISKKLSSRCLRFCEYAYFQQRSKKQEDEVMLLQLLSDQLRSELAMEMHLSHLVPHPLFERMAAKKFTCLVRGQIERGLMIVTEGQASYTFFGQGDSPTRAKQRLTEKDWLCEPALWTHWKTVGNAVADVNCRIVIVESMWFARILAVGPAAEWVLVHQYATKFIDMLNSIPKEHLCDITSAASASEGNLRIRMEDYVRVFTQRMSVTSYLFGSTGSTDGEDSVPRTSMIAGAPSRLSDSKRSSLTIDTQNALVNVNPSDSKRSSFSTDTQNALVNVNPSDSKRSSFSTDTQNALVNVKCEDATTGSTHDSQAQSDHMMIEASLMSSQPRPSHLLANQSGKDLVAI